jgi:hypothetical protein
MFRTLSAAVLMAPILVGCATAPEPCTAEWFDWKTERVLGEFAYDHRREIGNLRDQAALLLGPGAGSERPALGLDMLLTAIGAMQLVGDFAQYAWPEITDAVSECGTAPDASRLFADMLRREGVDERAVRAIEDMGQLMDLNRGRR